MIVHDSNVSVGGWLRGRRHRLRHSDVARRRRLALLQRLGRRRRRRRHRSSHGLRRSRPLRRLSGGLGTRHLRLMRRDRRRSSGSGRRRRALEERRLLYHRGMVISGLRQRRKLEGGARGSARRRHRALRETRVALHHANAVHGAAGDRHGRSAIGRPSAGSTVGIESIARAADRARMGSGG